MTKMCMELVEIIVKRNVHGTMKGDVSCELIQQGVSLTGKDVRNSDRPTQILIRPKLVFLSAEETV